jgi:hypothetical protein
MVIAIPTHSSVMGQRPCERKDVTNRMHNAVSMESVNKPLRELCRYLRAMVIIVFCLDRVRDKKQMR